MKPYFPSSKSLKKPRLNKSPPKRSKLSTFRKLWRLSQWGAGISGAVFMGWWTFNVAETFWEATAKPGLHLILCYSGIQVKNVWVKGRIKTSSQAILKATQLREGQSLLSYQPAHLKEQLEGLPWVAQAHVERRWPDTFWIYLQERQPLAVWQYQGVFKPIDQSGCVLTCSLKEIPPKLIRVVGEKACWRAPQLFKILDAFPQVKSRVVAAVYLRVGRWDLHLKNGWVIKLPEKQVETALRQFLCFEERVPFPKGEISGMDLRFKETLILKRTVAGNKKATPATFNLPSRSGKEV